MSTIQTYLQRAADKIGFQREFFIEKNLPTSSSSITTLVFFGDMRSTFVLSSLILRQYKERNPSRYIILVSWPEYKDLFPYVDEYWSPKESALTKLLALGADNFSNTSNEDIQIRRNLFEVMSDVISYKEILSYYDSGFTKKYWEEFQAVKRYLPGIPAISRIREDFKLQLTKRPGQKVILFPATRVRTWQQGKSVYVKIPVAPWKALTERLIADGIDTILFQNQFTYDLSSDFMDKCMYLVATKVNEVLTAMHYVGCVVDFFTGISRLAIAARCPFLAVDERMRFIKQKDYEIDDIGCGDMPRNYVFSFSTLLLTGSPSEWDASLFDTTMTGLKRLLTKLPNNGSITTQEVYEPVDYSKVREHRAKRLGAKFIKRRD